MRYVAVVGSGECSEELARLAYEVGSGLARRGVVVICGGRGGVMAAAARGVQETGGVVIGLLPGTSRAEGNPYLTFSLPTGLGEARNAVIACAAEALIAVGGGYGTLSEVALALKRGKRVVGLAFSFPQLPGIITAATPEEAVEKALSP
ncbi:TIGR00725 family protein [Desulfothermobacter acidiphilus]|uniref:TIGR00725 family protein n=1 Tax=Desulfothermobacter acidiphilus TaxID=1938353 RepID=UPI003F8A9BAC